MKWKHNGMEYERNNSRKKKLFTQNTVSNTLREHAHQKLKRKKTKNICIEKKKNELQHFAAFTSSDNRSQMNVRAKRSIYSPFLFNRFLFSIFLFQLENTQNNRVHSSMANHIER